MGDLSTAFIEPYDLISIQSEEKGSSKFSINIVIGRKAVLHERT